SPAAGRTTDSGRAGAVAPGVAGGAARGDCSGRFVGVGLRGRRGQKGILSTGAQGVSAGRRAMRCLRDSHTENRSGRTRDAFLSTLSAMNLGVCYGFLDKTVEISMRLQKTVDPPFH